MTKLVCRVLDREGLLLGWCAHEAILRGDGCLRASSPVSLTIDESGMPEVLSIHWTDVNVETRSPMPAVPLGRGDSITVFATNAVMIQAGAPPVQRLPPVTVRHTAVAVPVGQLGASGVASHA